MTSGPFVLRNLSSDNTKYYLLFLLVGDDEDEEIVVKEKWSICTESQELTTAQLIYIRKASRYSIIGWGKYNNKFGFGVMPCGIKI